MAYSSPEEADGYSDADQHLAEQYGTPPIRHSLSQSRMDKLGGGKKIRKLPSHSDLAKRDRPGRKNKHATKYERQKERLDARAFKELDTTLQVLGIDGSSADSSAHRITASPHTPVLRTREAKPKPAGKDSVAVAKAISSRLSLESSSSIASDGRPKFQGPSLSLAEQRSTGSPLAFLSRVSSRTDSLADERQKWLEGLDDLLHGNLDHDDLQVALSLASSKADDLKEQLIYWQTPPEPTWGAREERIEWLNQAMTQLRDVTIGLQQHGINIKDSSHMTLYHSILKEVLVEMGNMTDICCDAMVEGLQALRESSQDLHRAYRTSSRLIVLIAKPLDAKRRALKFEHCCGYTEYLERAANQCIKVLVAMMDATSDLQAALLQAPSLTNTLGMEISAHEVSDRCKQLQFAWSWCAEMTALLNTRIPEQASTVNCAWCALLLNAAGLANNMQQDLVGGDRQMSSYLSATSSSLSDDSLGTYGNTGVWCTSATAKEVGSAVSDEELQAQAWLPACLTALLANAQNAATAALGCGCNRTAKGAQGDAEGDWTACQGLVEELSDALYELAVTGNHRIGRMCVAPSGLACWALELLEEQACQAVVFVRDLDRSVLGRGEHGLTHYEILRQATDTLVNSIFRVRRLLKQKRTADAGDAMPRPLPGLARSDLQSNLTLALQRKPASQSDMGRAATANGTADTRSKSSGRPPLAANGHPIEPSQRAEGNIPTTSRGEGDWEASTQQLELSGRRQRSRHHHGAATPPIPEDSDGEAGRNQQVEQRDANGLDYREHRGRHHGRRHKYKRHRQQSRRSYSREHSPPESVATANGGARLAAPQGAPPAAAERVGDPFAQPNIQRPESTPAMRNLPLYVFSSENATTPIAMTPDGSRKTIKFGSFSTSPSQGNGVPSPRGIPTAPPSSTPFAGFLSIQNGFNSSLEKESSEGSSVSTSKLETKPPSAAPPKDLPGAALQARISSSKETSSDSFGHPMSDPTNGGYYSHSHAGLLSRISGEKLRREGSSDSSGESVPDAPSLSIAEPSSSVTGASEDPLRLLVPWDNDPDPFWQISWEALKPTIVRKIGNGSFGQVFEVYYHSAPMAIKIINIDGDATALPGALLRFKQEVDLQRMLSHFPYIVRFVGACCHIPDVSHGSDSAYTSSNVTLAIVMELCRFGTLFKLIEFARKVSNLPAEVLSGATPPRTPEEKRLKASPGFRLFNSWQLRLELAKHAAAAVEFMHSKNVIHRDLTSYNLLVTDKFEAKVADFNLSRAMKGEMIPSSGVINSPEWAAPERLSGQRIYNGFAADVFSFGVILWELVTLAWPWHEPEHDVGTSSGTDPPRSPRSQSAGVPEPDSVQQPHDPFFTVIGSVPRGERLKFPPCEDVRPSLPQLPQIVDLAEACWKQDPTERPTMTQVCAKLDSIISGIKQDARQRRRT